MAWSRADSRFTVLMPVHNRDDIFLLVDQAIESVFKNTITPSELVLVIDGPIHQAFEKKILLLESLYPLRVIRLPKNRGITYALNVGLESINTQWTMRADADDINLQHRFELQINALTKGYDLVGGAIEEVDVSGELLAVKSLPLDSLSIREYIRYRNPFNHMTVAFSTRLAKSIGGYPNIPLKEDYGLWALFVMRGAKITNLKEILVKATTGKTMFARRRGWSSIKSEVLLQRHLIKCGVQSKAMGLVIAVARIFMLLLPAKALTAFYIRYLRNKPNRQC